MSPVDPPPGLLDSIAEALNRFHHGGVLPWDEASEAMREVFHREARAAWDAVVEHLELTEEFLMRFERQADPTMGNPSGVYTCADTDQTCKRRLVSKWVEQR